MGIRIKMHEHMPGEGYVLQRFRGRLPSGSNATFEAGQIYEVSDADAAYLLAIRSRPDSERATVPFAFERMNAAAPAPKAPDPVVHAVTVVFEPEPEPEPVLELEPAVPDEPVIVAKPRARKPKTKKPAGK